MGLRAHAPAFAPLLPYFQNQTINFQRAREDRWPLPRLPLTAAQLDAGRAPRPRQIGSRGRRRGCSSARTSPPTGLEHGREQAQGPRSCTHGRGERPRTWPRDRVSVFCHVLSCLLNTCVHVCMFLPSHSAETVPDEPLPACQPSRIAPLPSASPERTGCARPALSIPSETLPGGRLPANRTRTCARNVGAHQHGARTQKVNSPEFLAICGRASSSRRRRHDSDAADRLPFRQGISGAARQATAPLLMTIGRRGGERCAGADGSNTPHGHRASPAEACSSQGLC